MTNKQLRTPMTHDGLFLTQALRSPFQAGAVLPSGPELAKAMAAQVDPALSGKVVELGPGTGTVTRALVERGIHPSRLILLETNSEFCRVLRETWPAAAIFQRDAYDAPALMREQADHVIAVVSSLPLILEPPGRRLRFVADCLKAAMEGAPFVQFTLFPAFPGEILRRVASFIVLLDDLAQCVARKGVDLSQGTHAVARADAILQGS